MDKIRVMIVDDHTMFAESLAALISMKDDIEVLSVVNSGKEAIEKSKSLKPDIVLMDIEMKDLNGIMTISKIKEKCSDIEFIILTMHSDEGYLLECMNVGTKGYILKESSSSEVYDAIKAVRQGKSYFDVSVSHKVIKNLMHRNNKMKRIIKDNDLLSGREVEILRMIAEGHTNKEISDKLFISPHTTRNHIKNIFSKLKCHTRTKAVAEGRKKQII